MYELLNLEKDKIINLNLQNSILLRKKFYGPFLKTKINDLISIPQKVNFANFIYKSNHDLNEVLLINSRRRIYLDIDNTYQEKSKMLEDIKNIIPQLNLDLKIFLSKYFNIDKNEFNIIYSNASGYNKKDNNYKMSFHVIISNLGVLTDHKKLEYLIELFLKEYKIYNNIIDRSVYSSFRLFRLNYSISPKDGEDRRLNPFILNKNNTIEYINYKDHKYFWNQFVVDYQSNEKILDNIIKLPNNSIPHKNKNGKIDNNIDFNILAKVVEKVKHIYNVHKITGNIVTLIRKNTMHCDICDREHNNENGYLLFKNNTVELHCYREKTYNKKEKILYPDSYSDNITIDNKIPQTQKCGIRDYITKNIKNKDLFNKYYYIGKMFKNGNQNKENIVNIISQYFKDKNIPKIKQRSIRIVNYIDYISNNIDNIKLLSLRNIFNMKKIEFNNLLKIPHTNTTHV
jgi:hypothetical protein